MSVLQWALQRSRAPREATPRVYPEPHSASRHRAARALNCVWGHLCFIPYLFCAFIRKMCPKVSEKPKIGSLLSLGMLKNLSIYINGKCLFILCHLAYERFHQNTTSGERVQPVTCTTELPDQGQCLLHILS